MTARTPLVALLFIVALLGAVVLILDEPAGRAQNGPAAVQVSEAGVEPQGSVAPRGGSASVDGPTVQRLATETLQFADWAQPPLPLLATGRVTGRLVDVRGQAIAGEPVELLVPDDPWRVLLRDDEKVELVDRGVSDEAGRFDLAARAGARQHLRGGGLRWARTGGVVVSAGDDVELELAEGLALTGYVLEQESGLPVPGAWVGSFSGTDKLLTRADQRGFFSLTPLPDEGVLIGAFLEGYDIGYHESVVPGWGPLTIELPPGRPVHGRVIDRQSDQGVPGAAVALELKSAAREVGKPDPFTGQRTIVEWTAVTGVDGRFSLEGCPSGQFRISVTADGYVPGGSDRYADRVLGPDQQVTVALNPAALITGQVVVEGGAAAVGAQVVLLSTSGPVAESAADDQGSFLLDLSTWDGKGALVISARDAAGRRASHRLRKRTRPVELSLVEPLVLGVMVSGATGPQAGAQVVITSDEAEPTLGTTDAGGRVHLVHPLAGLDIRRATVQARYGAAESLPQTIILSEPRPSDPLILDLTEGDWFTGVVQDIYGTPISQATVTVGHGGFGRADSSGYFSVGPVIYDPAKTVGLRAEAPGYHRAKLAEVTPQQSLVITLEPVVLWKGKVSDAVTGEPLDVFRGRVFVEKFEDGKSVWKPGERAEVTGVPGEFAIELGEAGTLKLQLRAPEYMTGESQPVPFDGVNSPPWTDLFLNRAALLDVFVSDSAGRPVSGYSLSVVPEARAQKSALPGGSVRKKSKSSRTERDGKVRFNLGEGGSYRLASGPGEWLDERAFTVRPGPPTERFMNVGGTGSVSVVVLGEDGEIMTRPKASVRSLGADHKHSVKRRLGQLVDGDELVASGLPEGRYELEVHQRGYVTVSREIWISVGGVSRESVELELEPPLEAGQLNQQMIEQLKALGYIGG
ncbi:MAG: hypothetical protein ACI9EF_000117 [Pseudohongiellaceae bacterium]|jgi:hypothetical protein